VLAVVSLIGVCIGAWYARVEWHLGYEAFVPANLQSKKRLVIVQRPFFGEWNSAEKRSAENSDGELSMEDMIKVARQKRWAGQGERAGVDLPEVNTEAAATAQAEQSKAPTLVKPKVELPCMFTPKQQPDKRPGDKISMNFFDLRYKKMWNYARAQTAGCLAIRYKNGGYSKSDQAYVLWPSDKVPGGGGMTGLVLGLIDCSMVTVHPFPISRMLLGTIEEQPPAEMSEGELLHQRLRSAERRQQPEMIAELSEAQRKNLIIWMASAGKDKYW